MNRKVMKRLKRIEKNEEKERKILASQVTTFSLI
jgi:hypothetical protein